MNELHSLLKQQLRRFTSETKPFLKDNSDLLRVISDAYWQFDADREMLEHSLELTSQELLERNAELSRINSELEMRVAARTVELSSSEARFRGLFEHVPVSIWEEDFSGVKQYIDTLRNSGIVDFSAYFDSHPEAIAECAMRVKIVDVNRATLEMYQAESKTQLLADLSKVLGPESLSPLKEELIALARGDVTFENETINYTLRGESRVIFLRLTVAPGYEQTWSKVFVGISDITERRQAEAKLQQSEVLFRALFDLSPDAVLVIDPHDSNVSWPIIDCNVVACLMNGYRRDELIGHSIDILNITLGTEAERIAYIKQLREVGHLKLETYHRRKNGVVFPVEVSTTLITVGERELVIGIDRDITERKQIEDALREAEIKYRTLVEHLPAIVYLDQYDPTVPAGYRPIYMSPQVETILGYRPDEFIEDPDLWPSLLHPDDRERALTVDARHYEVGDMLRQEYHVIARDGRVVWLRDEAVMIRDEVNGKRFSQGVLLDITERKQAEEALLQSEERFRLMSWATKDAVWDWDLRTNQIWWGGGLQKVFHYSSETTQTDIEWWRNHVHPEDKDKVSRSMNQALEGGMEFWSKEYRFQRVDRTYADIMDRGYIIRDDAGKPFRMIGAMIDITERKQAEQALLASEARYRQIVETAGDIIYRVNTRGHLTYVNPTALHIMGYKVEADVLDRQYLEFVHPAWRDRVRHTYKRQFREKSLNTYMEFLALTQARNEIWLGQNVQLVMENNRVTGFQVVARDITLQKQAEAALQDANEKMGRSLNELALRNHEIALLNEMSDLLQASRSERAAHTIIGDAARQLFPGTMGALYLFNTERTLVNSVASWGEPPPAAQTFAPDDCWALRRGQTRQLYEEDAKPLCRHLFEAPPVVSYCLPMVAQNEILGVLHLQSPSKDNLTEPKRQLAYTVVEQAGMALSNLKLREALREQSIRDPLTGLYNRRYMEEVLKQHLRRVTRHLHPLGMIMIDIDHFKNFNDAHGHAAGDALLRELGRFLQSHIRGEDVACRYGGEEFILIMPDTSLETARQRAEYLRDKVKGIHVHDAGQSLGEITLSLGVAIYPQHGRTMEAVMRAADAALYRAKQDGRDRVVVAAG